MSSRSVGSLSNSLVGQITHVRWGNSRQGGKPPERRQLFHNCRVYRETLQGVHKPHKSIGHFLQACNKHHCDVMVDITMVCINRHGKKIMQCTRYICMAYSRNKDSNAQNLEMHNFYLLALVAHSMPLNSQYLK